jgi:methylated-DNA-[protein]-cysteine S-methyltransferase
VKTKALCPSPLGDLTLVAEDDVLVGLYMTDQRHLPTIDAHRDDDALPAVREELAAYFAGELEEFTVPVRMHGSPFQQAVWAGLREIPYGQTWTYGQLAAAIGRPAASRAVGLANGRNPISVIVPCHRVVGTKGLTGYGGGLARKQQLLDLEQGPAHRP